MPGLPDAEAADIVRRLVAPVSLPADTPASSDQGNDRLTPLRITHLSHNDQRGGGPLASYRLHRTLLDLDVDSRMLVLESHRHDPTVARAGSPLVAAPARLADRLPLRLYPKRRPGMIWSPGCFGLGGAARHPWVMDADIIGLYWVNGGLLSIGDIGRLLRLGKPVVWRLSDLWPFTGGCHHAGTCDRYRDTCGRCPQLGSRSDRDLSARQLRRKRAWPRTRLTIVAPSRWLADLARRSALFRDCRIEHIATGVDLDIYRPRPKGMARRKLDLPIDRSLVLFGANNAVGNTRKGFAKLIEALQSLQRQRRISDVDLVLFGSNPPPALPLDMRVHAWGTIDDEAVRATLFSAADVFVTPSLEENLPNVVIEAMAAGTPAVAFDVGGTRELIDHRQTGYLATPGDIGDLADGLTFVLDTTLADRTMARRARQAMAVGHDRRTIARRYLDLYRELLGGRA